MAQTGDMARDGKGARGRSCSYFSYVETHMEESLGFKINVQEWIAKKGSIVHISYDDVAFVHQTSLHPVPNLTTVDEVVANGKAGVW